MSVMRHYMQFKDSVVGSRERMNLLVNPIQGISTNHSTAPNILPHINDRPSHLVWHQWSVRRRPNKANVAATSLCCVTGHQPECKTSAQRIKAARLWRSTTPTTITARAPLSPLACKHPGHAQDPGRSPTSAMKATTVWGLRTSVHTVDLPSRQQANVHRETLPAVLKSRPSSKAQLRLNISAPENM
ncbi:hypothetical protein C8R44DRAFT_855369 [Mycena epipterygia]|nr:hypothetical protein C8R44DRAFT_855369 [Mycena epipterygia]